MLTPEIRHVIFVLFIIVYSEKPTAADFSVFAQVFTRAIFLRPLERSHICRDKAFAIATGTVCSIRSCLFAKDISALRAASFSVAPLSWAQCHVFFRTGCGVAVVSDVGLAKETACGEGTRE